MNTLKKLVESKPIVKEKKEREKYLKYYRETYGIILRDKQLEVIESKEQFLELTFERREGCSTAAMIKAIEYAINNQRSRVLLVCQNRVISNVRRDEIINMLSNSSLNRHVLRTTRNPNVIEFLNGSRITTLDIRTSESLRGAVVDCLIVDGKSYLSEYELGCAICCTLHKDDTQVVMLDQEDLINGQPINI